MPLCMHSRIIHRTQKLEWRQYMEKVMKLTDYKAQINRIHSTIKRSKTCTSFKRFIIHLSHQNIFRRYN